MTKSIIIVVDNLDGNTLIVESEDQAKFLLDSMNKLYAREAKDFRRNNEIERFAWETHSDKCHIHCYHFTLVKKNDQSK